MAKHAYLIMAHNQPKLLEILIQCLDYHENDIYVHLDQKWTDFDGTDLYKYVKKSKLYILKDRYDVRWGSYSQILCEVRLLEEAVKKHYSYYHLMSGMDLPLKPQKEIHEIFDKSNNIEYIHFDAPEIDSEVYKRVSKYNFFASKSKKIWEKIAYHLIMALQFKVDLGKKYGLTFQKGANWFSITDELVQYVIDNKNLIEKVFKHTRCADEVFLQTLVVNSKFKNHISPNNFCDNYESILYCIDWKRGYPYVYRDDDYDELIGSNMCFARKFDINVDAKIVEKIKNHVLYE